MKMTLRLYRNRSLIESIAGFAFTEANNYLKSLFNLVWSGSVDFDPLIEEQVVRIDFGTSSAYVDYAGATPDAALKQAMDGNPPAWFYHVVGIDRKYSSTVVAIKLRLDGATTLFNAIQKGGGTLERVFTAQSFIRREHRGRFLAPESTNYSQYEIDKVKENIPVELKKFSKRELYGNSDYERALKWYIVYKSRQNWGEDVSSANALDVYFCPEHALRVAGAGSSGSGSSVTWRPLADHISEGNHYYVIASESPNYSFAITGYRDADLSAVTSHTFTSSAGWLLRMRLVKNVATNVDRLDVSVYQGTSNNVTAVANYEFYGRQTENVIYASFTRLTQFRVLPSSTTSLGLVQDGSVLTVNAGTTAVPAVYSLGFSDIDRTDPLLVKIVESPYAPSILLRDSNLNFSLASCDFDPSTLMWKPTSSTPWRQALTDQGYVNIPTGKRTAKYIGAASYTDSWDGFDPKLLNSEFYAIKIVYDVYSTSIELENEDIPSSRYADISGRVLSIYWHITPDIGSIFAIEANLLYLAEPSLPSRTQDFGSFCVVDRNNEKPLFTNAYLNYMRVGYNYDQKAKSLQNWSSILGIALSAAGTAAGAATGQAAITAASATSLISSIASASMGAASRENSLQGKMAQLKAQGTSVAGASDVAILNLYSPRVSIIEYFPDDAIASSLAVLFHRFGYATNQFKAPDIQSRSLWNYLEGDVVIDQAYATGIPHQVIARTIAQVKEGLTIFHGKHGFYNLDQSYENWEEDVIQ